jgi:hypothetical protein
MWRRGSTRARRVEMEMLRMVLVAAVVYVVLSLLVRWITG